MEAPSINTIGNRLTVTEKKLLSGFAIIVAITIASTSFQEAESLHRDSAVFAYFGRAILDGSVPYQDVWDHKTPGIYYIDAAIFWLLPDSILSIHAVEGMIMAMASLTLYAVARALAIPRLSAGFGAVLYAVFLTTPAFYQGGNLTETYLQLPLLLGFLLLIKAFPDESSPLRPHLAYGCGLLFGIAVMIRPTALLHAIVALAFWSLHLIRGYHSMKWYLSWFCLFVLGISTPVLITVIYFGFQGALDDMYQQVVVYNALYFSAAGDDTGALVRLMLRSGWAAFSNAPLLWALGLSGLAVLVLSRMDLSSRVGYLLLPLFAADALSVLAGGNFYGHYYLLVIPSLSLLGAYAMARVSADLVGVRWNPLWVTLAVSVTVLILAPMSIRWAGVFFSIRAPIIEAYDQDLINRVVELSDEEDYIYVWGAEPGVYLLSDRRAASRYIYNYPLIGRFGRRTVPERIRQDDMSIFLGELNRHPPKLVLIAPAHNDLSKVPQFRSFLTEGYENIGEQDGWHLYLHNSGEPTPQTPDPD